MEEPEAFEAVHALPLRLHAEGIVDGLRIDHVDGLPIPPPTAASLARAARETRRAISWSRRSCCAGETLPADWGCDGTTGYDFMDEVSAAAARPGRRARAGRGLGGAERPAGRFRRRGGARPPRDPGAQLRRPARRLRRPPSPGGELVTGPLLRRAAGRAAGALPGLSHLRPRRRALGRRRAVLDRAAAGARRTCLATDRWAIDPLLRRFAERDRGRRRRALPAAQRADRRQGGRGHRLLSLRPPALAQRCRLRSGTLRRSTPTPSTPHAAPPRRLPRALLATATHDHKRGEDVRARLAVLSGMAAEWAAAAARWVEASRPLRTRRRAGPPATSPCCCRRSSAPGPSTSTPATAPAAPPSPSAWSPGSRRRCARPSSPATGPRSDEAYEAAARDFTLALVADAALPDLLQRDRGLRAAHRAGRRDQRPGAVPAAPDRAGRARSLPGHRALGSEPGRSRQPPAGRLAAARRRARPAEPAADAGRALARRRVKQA